MKVLLGNLDAYRNGLPEWVDLPSGKPGTRKEA